MEKLSDKKYYIRTYGCQMNKYDSQMVKTILNRNGFHQVDAPENADYIFINTCSVREHAEKRVMGRLNSLREIKRKSPSTRIVMMGCMVKGNENLIERDIVDILAPPDSYRNLDSWLSNNNNGLVPEIKNESYSDVFIDSEGVSAYISITRGCNHFCSYCIVPYKRGRIRCRPLEDIMKEARDLADSGVGDITLLGQNINAYSYRGLHLPGIIREVASIEGIKRLSFLTSHPSDIPDNLFETMKEHDNVVKYLHLPLQSASNRILFKMKRRYTREDYLQLVNRARRIMPDLTLTTDVMVGFPGEKKEDFLKTLEMVRKVRFKRAFMFSYSNRKKTLANLSGDQVEEEEKKKRLKNLIKVQNEITGEEKRKLIGKKEEVYVFKNAKKGGRLGKTVSGEIVLVEKVAKIGSTYIVKINDINGWTPVGKIEKEG